MINIQRTVVVVILTIVTFLSNGFTAQAKEKKKETIVLVSEPTEDVSNPDTWVAQVAQVKNETDFSNAKNAAYDKKSRRKSAAYSKKTTEAFALMEEYRDKRMPLYLELKQNDLESAIAWLESLNFTTRTPENSALSDNPKTEPMKKFVKGMRMLEKEADAKNKLIETAYDAATKKAEELYDLEVEKAEELLAEAKASAGDNKKK
ncbi:MAG: hypothetical protein RL094_366 [Candidatus Parcubacteria bacterium]|jgi:hypothetical protein